MFDLEKYLLTRGARRCMVPLFLLVTLLSIGCSDRLRTYPVKGQVLFRDGKTAHMGTIEFRSKEHGIQARGQIGDDGRFQLTTYKPGDGAVAGLHDCVIVQLVITEGIKHKPSTYGLINPKYASYRTTELMFDVSPTIANDFKVVVDGVEAPYGATNAHEHDKDEHAVPPEPKP